MHDPFAMRHCERVRKRAGDLHDLLDGQSALGNAMVERLPFHQLHGEEVHAIGFFDGINRDDMRVVERREGASFTLEAREALRVARHVRRKNLQRDFAPELRVGGAIHLTHSPRANCGVDSVMCECTSDQTQTPRVATHQLFVPEPSQQSYTKAAPSGFAPDKRACVYRFSFTCLICRVIGN